jgi:thiamine-monophosphate kinase
MLINKIGEFGLINRFRKSIALDRSVIVGPGDDCAVLSYDTHNYQLASCDMLVENVDFTRKDDPLLVGRKALAVSISDIAACGGIPTHALVSLGLPRKTDVKFAEAVGKGLIRLAQRFGINIIGGDISRAAEVVVNVTILGMVEKKRLVLRSGAQKGDVIFVTGGLGGSIRGRHLRFDPRLEEARYLVKNFKINAMIDISDGLAQDLAHVAEESRGGAAINEELIPLAADAANRDEALYMGEDFELLFTLAPKEARRLVAMDEFDFSPIGTIVDRKKGLRITGVDGSTRVLKKGGWRHF